MTREEFISNGVAWHGSAVGWQSALAKALDIEARTIRRAVKDGPTDRLSAAMLALFGDAAPPRKPAEWICGDGDDGHEYLVHIISPKFASLVLTDDEYQDFGPKTDADFWTGEAWLAAHHWIDRRPDNLAQWLDRAADALDAMA